MSILGERAVLMRMIGPLAAARLEVAMVLNRRRTLFGLTAAGGAVAMSACRPATAQSTRKPARPDLYTCEGCEAVGERDAATLSSRLRLAALDEPGERMLLTGQVRTAADGRPAAGVVVYAHHTNARGLYADGASDSEWSRRHGRLRGWVRTDADGRYAFDTIKPAPYPGFTDPAHVHLFIGEPGRRPYYIDDVVFDGEFGVTPAYRARQPLRGGDGVVRLSRDADGRWLAVRDIRLEPHPA